MYYQKVKDVESFGQEIYLNTLIQKIRFKLIWGNLILSLTKETPI